MSLLIACHSPNIPRSSSPRLRWLSHPRLLRLLASSLAVCLTTVSPLYRTSDYTRLTSCLQHKGDHRHRKTDQAASLVLLPLSSLAMSKETSGSPSSSRDAIDLTTATSSAEVSRSPPTLAPFDETSFSLWKLRTIAVFLGAGLLDVVESPIASVVLEEERIRAAAVKAENMGTRQEETPASGSHTGVLPRKRSAIAQEHVRQSRLAYAALLSALKTEQLRLIQHITPGDAHAVWKELLGTYERVSLATRVQLMEEIIQMELKQGERIATYVARDRAEAAGPGGAALGWMVLYFLLRGVTRQYPTLVTMLKMQEAKFDAAVTALKNEEERMRMDRGRGGAPSTSSTAPHDTAHFATAHGSSGQLVCFTCEKDGHVKFDCS